MNRKFLTSAGLLACVAVSNAATLISDFSSSELIGGANFFDTWENSYTDNSTFGTIGSPATDFGSMIYVFAAPLDISGDTHIDITARLESGNTATGFSVILYTGLEDFAFVNFSTGSLGPSFQNLSLEYVSQGNFDPSNVIGFGISGGAPFSSTAFRMSFDSISTSAIPEPATFAALAGMATLGLAVVRRRKVRAV